MKLTACSCICTHNYCHSLYHSMPADIKHAACTLTSTLYHCPCSTSLLVLCTYALDHLLCPGVQQPLDDLSIAPFAALLRATASASQSHRCLLKTAIIQVKKICQYFSAPPACVPAAAPSCENSYLHTSAATTHDSLSATAKRTSARCVPLPQHTTALTG